MINKQVLHFFGEEGRRKSKLNLSIDLHYSTVGSAYVPVPSRATFTAEELAVWRPRRRDAANPAAEHRQSH